jgi:hypothetical protein
MQGVRKAGDAKRNKLTVSKGQQPPGADIVARDEHAGHACTPLFSDHSLVATWRLA